MCALFIEAARALLVLLPTHSKAGRNAELDMDLGPVAEELAKAQRWFAANGGRNGNAAGVGYYDLSEPRR